MRRLACLGPIVALLCLSPAVDAGVVDAPPPVFVAKDKQDARANRLNLQAALDQAGTDPAYPGRGAVGLLRLGPYRWEVDGPLFLDTTPGPSASVGIQGAGPGLSQVAMKGFSGYDVFVVGVPRGVRVGGAAPSYLDPANFPPTPLDATAAGRTAFRTLGRVKVSQNGGHLDQGAADGYAGATGLTLEAAVTFHEAAGLNNATVMGIKDPGNGLPAPIYWQQIYGRPAFCVGFNRSLDDPESWQTSWTVCGDAPLSLGVPHRITVQWDLAAGKFDAWIDDVRVSTSQVFNTAPVPAGARLASNQTSPWVIGGWQVAGSSSPTPDITLSGLRISASTPYKTGVTPLSRVDGSALTDASRYFSSVPSWFALLPFARSPADIVQDRVVPVWGRSYLTSIVESGAYALEPNHSNDFVGYWPGPMSGFGTERGDPYYGRGLVFGRVYGAQVRQSKIYGGANGIGDVPLGPKYPLLIEDCSLSGRSSPLELTWVSGAVFNRILLQEIYRTGRPPHLLVRRDQRPDQFALGVARIRDLRAPHVRARQERVARQ
jgi:hypothetical protein